MGTSLAAAKTLALSAVESALGPNLFGTLASRFNREPAFDMAATAKRQQQAYSGAQPLSRENLTAGLLKAGYSGSDPNLLVPDQSVPSAYSFVPYYKGITRIVLFNFFRINYGIRDPVLFRLSVLDGRTVVACEQFLLSADAVVELSDPVVRFGNLPAHGSILLEAFHPRMDTPGRQLRYFVFYRDGASGSISGVHSMVFAPSGLTPLSSPSYRAFGVGGISHRYHSPTRSHSPLVSEASQAKVGRLTSDSAVAIPGYMTAETPDGVPVAIWHDGPTPHFVVEARERQSVSPPYTAFFIPDFRAHAPLLLVSASQIGFPAKRMVVHLIDAGGSLIASKTVELKSDPASVDLAATFASDMIAGPVSAIVEFDRDIGEFTSLPACYLHIYYRSPGGWSDQVHSHNTIGYAEDPFRTARAYRCRKFAPFLADPTLDFHYSIINIGPGRRPLRDSTIRIRMFTDAGEEHVWNEQLSPHGITNFKASEFLSAREIKIGSAAIIHFEHESTNFNGAWYAWDPKSGHLAVDHLTGG